MHEKRTLIHQKVRCGENYYTLVIKRVFSTAAIKSKGKFFIFCFIRFVFALTLKAVPKHNNSSEFSMNMKTHCFLGRRKSLEIHEMLQFLIKREDNKGSAHARDPRANNTQIISRYFCPIFTCVVLLRSFSIFPVNRIFVFLF